MKFKQFAVLVVIGLFATTVWSGEEMHQKIEVKVVSDDGDGETRLVLDSGDLGFNLHEMQVGENQSIVDKEGRAVLVTRNEDGFSFEVDGKTIEMPAFDGHHGMARRAMLGDEGVMIISGKEIDEATQQVIRTALESAGHESVHFAGGHEGGQRQVHVIRKVVEVSE